MELLLLLSPSEVLPVEKAEAGDDAEIGRDLHMVEKCDARALEVRGNPHEKLASKGAVRRTGEEATTAVLCVRGGGHKVGPRDRLLGERNGPSPNGAHTHDGERLFFTGQ